MLSAEQYRNSSPPHSRYPNSEKDEPDADVPRLREFVTRLGVASNVSHRFKVDDSERIEHSTFNSTTIQLPHSQSRWRAVTQTVSLHALRVRRTRKEPVLTQ